MYLNPWQKLKFNKILFLIKYILSDEEVGKIDAYHEGHLWTNDGIVGDGYKFHGNNFDVIVVGSDKGIYKNDKKMSKDEFEKLPNVFKSSLRLQPEWNA